MSVQKKNHIVDLDEALDRISVIPPELLDASVPRPKGWWAVANDKGIVAYFGKEKDLSIPTRFGE